MSDFLRMCSGCNAQLVTNDHAADAYCGRCRPMYVPSFREWAAGLTETSTVFLQPYAARFAPASIARSVVKREGAWLTVEVPDVPDSAQRVHIADCGPRNLVPLSMRGAAW